MSRRHLLPVVTVGLAAAVLLPASPASALPVDSGPVLQPPTTTTAASPHGVRSITVTTDSVVATATILYDGAPAGLSVLWGDGATSRPSTAPPTASVPGHPAASQAGTFVFQHLYAAPDDGSAFTTRVSVVTPDGVHGQDVIVTPRFRVTQYTLYFAPLNHCDTLVEEYTEWTVERDGAGIPHQRWDFDRKTHVRGEVGDRPPDFKPIPGSAISFDITAVDSPAILYSVSERDLLHDDIGATKTLDLRPRLGSRTVVLHYVSAGSASPTIADCRADLRADIDVRLLTPGLPAGPVASR